MLKMIDDALWAEAHKNLRKLTGTEPYYMHVIAYARSSVFRARVRRALKRRLTHRLHDLVFELAIAWQGYYIVGEHPGYCHVREAPYRVEIEGNVFKRLWGAVELYRNTRHAHKIDTYTVLDQHIEVEFPV